MAPEPTKDPHKNRSRVECVWGASPNRKRADLEIPPASGPAEFFTTSLPDPPSYSTVASGFHDTTSSA